MVILLTVIHVIVCLFLVVVVLLQSGKAADLAGAFGGMGSQTVFGPRGSATVLSKATTIAAAVFMVHVADAVDLAKRGRSCGSPALLNKAQADSGADATRGTAAGQGQTVPITVTPSARRNQAGEPRQIQAPVVPIAESAEEEVEVHLRRWRNWQTH